MLILSRQIRHRWTKTIMRYIEKSGEKVQTRQTWTWIIAISDVQRSTVKMKVDSRGLGLRLGSLHVQSFNGENGGPGLRSCDLRGFMLSHTSVRFVFMSGQKWVTG
jgi:hypothetical protein